MANADEIVDFWFGQVEGPYDIDASRQSMWWKKDAEVDRTIRERFGDAIEGALRGELDDWAETAKGRLALILLLDQMTRNAFRDTPRAFEGDPKAEALALEGIDRGHDRELPYVQRAFLYMPLMHAEDRECQKRSVASFEAMAEEVPEEHRSPYASFADFARRHAAIVERFGRYPHRNAILGRHTTPGEAAFLEEPGSGF